MYAGYIQELEFSRRLSEGLVREIYAMYSIELLGMR